MQNLTLLFTISLVHLLGVIIPGPDFIMTIRNSLTYGRKVGIYTSLGLGLGMLVHITYCAFGLAVIISKSIIIFNIIKLLGASYLIYIGIKSYFSKSSRIEVDKIEAKEQLSPISAIKIGFLTNVLNPKATLFFLSLFTLIISPNIPSHILVIASSIMFINSFVWFSLVSIFFTQTKVKKVFEKFQNTFNKIFGVILVGLGVKLATTHK